MFQATGRSVVHAGKSSPLHAAGIRASLHSVTSFGPWPLAAFGVWQNTSSSITNLSLSHFQVRFLIVISTQTGKYQQSLDMAAQSVDVNMFTSPFQLTKGMHRDVYPAIEPSNPGLSAKGKVVIITGAGGGLGAVSVQIHLFRNHIEY